MNRAVRRAMTKLVPLVVCGLVLLGLSATAASGQTVNVSIGRELAVGMKIFVTVGGDGANCTGGATAVVGKDGTATVSIVMHCAASGRPPTPGPNDKCRIMARALDEKADTSYVGRGVLSPTSVQNVYQSKFSLTAAP